jgi:hypothetical protein
MKKQNYSWHAILVTCVIAVLPFSGCEKDPLVLNGDRDKLKEVIQDSLDRAYQNLQDSLHRAYWEGVAQNARLFDSLACSVLNRPADPNHMDEAQLLSGPTITMQNGIRCVTSNYRWQLGDQSAFLYDPNADVFFVTSVLDGTSIQTGAYRPITAPISPKTLSISLENVGGSPRFLVEHPTLASVREATANMLRQLASQSTSARLSMTMEQISSAEQTAIAVRSNFRGFGARVNASFNWNNTEVKSRFLLNFLQIYYTIDVDNTHGSPSEYFVAENLPNMADFNGGMPVYVSSVKYGRQIMFAVESTRSASEVRAALQASYNAVLAGGGVGISFQNKQVLEQSNISAFVVGGSGAVAAQNIGSSTTLLDIMRAGGEYSADSPGAPLAYTLRYVCDKSVAKIALSAEYTVRECEEIGIEHSFTPTNNNNQGYYYCALRTNGDGEFGGNGPLVTGTITLKPKNAGREIWCHLKVTWVEQGGDRSTGVVDREFHLHTLPPGKQFIRFTDSDKAYFEYLESNGSNPDFPPVTGGNFVQSVRVIGDTSGNDLGCDGDADANIRLWLKPIKIMVRNI